MANSSAPLHPIIAHRWSPRALDPGAELTEEQLRSLFEAARWAPSWGNNQPARYVVGRRGEDAYDKIFDTLVPGNKKWAFAAAALAIGIAVKLDENGAEVPYAEYGLGLATENLVLEAVAQDLVAHQMAGFSREAAKALFELPEGYEPMVAIALGKLGDPATVSPELLKRDARPRSRKPLSELVWGERWNEPRF